MCLRRRAVHIVGTEGRSSSVVELFSVSLQVSKPQDESTARRRDCPSDTALGKSKSSLYNVSLTRTVPSLSRRHRESELKSPPVHQLLAPNFSLCALRLARPLLSCHPSCPHAPRCPIVAIQLFIFLFLSPPPQPLGMCRLYDSRRDSKGGWGVASSVAPYFAVWRILVFYVLSRGEGPSVHPKAPREATQNHGTVCAPVPRSEATPLRSKF